MSGSHSDGHRSIRAFPCDSARQVFRALPVAVWVTQRLRSVHGPDRRLSLRGNAHRDMPPGPPVPGLRRDREPPLDQLRLQVMCPQAEPHPAVGTPARPRASTRTTVGVPESPSWSRSHDSTTSPGTSSASGPALAVDTEASEDVGGDALVLDQQPEQEVPGADGRRRIADAVRSQQTARRSRHHSENRRCPLSSLSASSRSASSRSMRMACRRDDECDRCRASTSTAACPPCTAIPSRIRLGQ